MKAMIKNLTILAIFCLAGTGAFAQSTDDTSMGNAHDLSEIVNEWNDWHANPTPQNAFIEDFMQDHNVPQKGQDGLNRKEVWYWWASHHPVQVQDYIDRRDSQ